VIEFDPTASVEVLYVAIPLLIVPVPSVVVPFINVTVPLAVDGVTVAVKVTVLSYVDGFNEEARVTEEEDFANPTPTKAVQKNMRRRLRNLIRFTIRFL